MGFEHRIGPLASSKDRQAVGLDMQRRQQGIQLQVSTPSYPLDLSHECQHATP
jgi:hypothetical protein